MTDRPDEVLGMVWKLVEEALGKMDLSEELRNRAVMVLDELLTNICSYGTRGDSDREPVSVEVWFDIDENLRSLGIFVTDSGIPFNPLTVMEGMTILMMTIFPAADRYRPVWVFSWCVSGAMIFSTNTWAAEIAWKSF